MHVARLLPASIRRAFVLMGQRGRAIVADMPLLFFGVVIGVALLFRLGVSAAREASTPPVVAPTFVTGAEPGRSATTDVKLEADPSAGALPAPPSTAPAAEVGAAARVQPIGPLSPPPSRTAPRSRGRGRRPIRSAPFPAGER